MAGKAKTTIGMPTSADAGPATASTSATATSPSTTARIPLLESLTRFPVPPFS